MFKTMSMCRPIKKEKKINEEICVCTDREHRFLTRNYHLKSC